MGKSETRMAWAAAIAAAVGGCSTMAPEANWAPAPDGASWETAQRNTGSYGKDVQFKVTNGRTTWNGAPARTMVNSLGATIVAQEDGGRWMAMLGRDGKPMVSFEPPIGWEWPLKVGKSWTKRHRMTVHATGKSIEYDFSCKVEDFEKVSVRAGTFDAYRIHCTTTSGNDEMYWTSPGLQPFVKTSFKRLAGNPLGAGTQESELVSLPR